MPCTRVVFGARAKLGSGFHFISGPPSTLLSLLWSVMDFLPPSRHRLSLSPNVYYTQGVGGEVSGARKGLARVDIQLEILSSTVLILFSLVFFPPSSVSSLFSFPFATYLLTGWIVELLDWRTLNENVSGSFEKPVLSLARVYWLAFIPRNFFLRFCKLFPMKIRFISGGRFLFHVIVPSEYLRPSYASARSATIVLNLE